MKRISALFILVLAASPAFCQQLPLNKQADLQGHYAGISQKHIDFLKRAPAEPDTPALIKQETDTINAYRQRWANTPYKADFEKAFHDEITNAPKKPATPPPTPPRVPPTTTYVPPKQTYTPPSPPFEIPAPMKLGLFILAVWFSRKLWKAAPAFAAPVTVDYNKLKVQLGSKEKASLQEAQQRRDNAVAKIDAETAKLNTYQTQLCSTAAGLAARGSALAGRLVAGAVSQLNQEAPEYHSLVEGLEAKQPALLAPWSSSLWEDFARQPQHGLPEHVRIGEYVETGTFPGETGVTAPYIVDLLSSKGPVIIQFDANSKATARAVVQNIVLRAALASPAETRFSLVDSSGYGFPFAAALPRVRPSTGEPADQFPAIIADIRRINQKVVGMNDNFAALTAEERAGEMFDIVAVLEFPAAYQRQIGVMENLGFIAESGPHAGCHLILEWNGTPSEADLVRFPNATIVDVRGNAASPRFDPVPPSALIQNLLKASEAAKPKTTVGDWDKQVRPTPFFAENSAAKIETPMGERLRFWFGAKERRTCAHAMVAGQSGSGKSVLLHVLITGLASRYSPDELRFILVDGKTGVEFKAYESLPHADVACLNTSPAVARSVLADVLAEMLSRYAKFPANRPSIEDYRNTGQSMPRMIVIVDEFQQLLEGDPDEGAEMLKTVLEKGRAAGIHLVLASQEFDVSGFPSSAMSQVHLRACLTVSSDYVPRITAFSREGREMITALSGYSQVVINDESGKDTFNSRSSIADFPPAMRSRVIPEICDAARAKSPGAKGPVVLNGNDAAVLAENPFVAQWKSHPPDADTLQTVARKSIRDGGFGLASWSKADRGLPLWCGRRFDVHGHLVVPLRRASTNNLFALGSKTAARVLMLGNALVSLRSMRPLDNCEILLLDGIADEQSGAGVLATALDFLRGAGVKAQRVTPEDAVPALEQFAAAPRPASVDAFRLLILSEPERFPELEAPPGYGPPPAGPSRLFKDLLRSGPVQGTHTIVTASNLAALTGVVQRDMNLFQHRVVQQINDEDSMSLFTSPVGITINGQTGEHQMGALYVDNVQGWRAGQFFKSYAAARDQNADQSAAGFTAAIQSIYGGAQ